MHVSWCYIYIYDHTHMNEYLKQVLLKVSSMMAKPNTSAAYQKCTLKIEIHINNVSSI